MSILLHSLDESLLERWASAFEDPLALYRSASLSTLTQRFTEGNIDLAYVDLATLPGGADTLNRLVGQFPSVGLIAMTSVPDPAEGLRLIGAGVRGYCNRLIAADLLALVQSTVELGEIWAGTQVMQHLLGQHQRQAQAPERWAEGGVFPQLTEREREISELVANGLSNKVIATQLGISERTVKAHLNAVFRKTGLSSRTQLALALQSTPASTYPSTRAG